MKKLFIIEMSSNTTETISRGTMKETKKECLKRAWQYYEESKERLQKMTRDRTYILSEEEKNKKDGQKRIPKIWWCRNGETRVSFLQKCNPYR